MRIIDSGACDAAWNMAMDDVLLEGPAPLTLRFYRWMPVALSLGKFQRLDDATLQTLAALDMPWTRRMTGGGAIVHADEVTYALVGADDEPPFRGDVAASYRFVHDALLAVLRRHHVAADYAESAGAPTALRHAERPFYCYARSTALDVVVDGLKLVGSAKRRRGGRALQHGSIVLGVPPAGPATAALRRLAPALADADRLAREVSDELARRLGVRPIFEGPTAPEAAAVAARVAQATA